MPKRNDIDTIMIIGAGPIIIGQACEFDYSGTQACKALKQEGYRIVLVNSNPATIMTDPNMADATYIEPITPEIVAKILQDERQKHPDDHIALLPTMGGQTALNTALALEKNGILDDLKIEMIGAKADVIDKAEDRERFRQAMDKIGLESPKSCQVSDYEGALLALKQVGLPAIIRPSFTMGGTGGGIATNETEFENIVKGGLDASPTNTVLIEESVLGWKEFEMEVVRDKDDNCIIICAIENIDPMGIHTGDSITIAPALTLSDREYQVMRNASIKVLREIGVETGGSNVQFAVNPKDGRLVVIEMNPRVSRSSALASKATGFPIAKIAAKLAVGYSLDELKNDITQITPASFEPSIDYIVTKIPRFTFEKFPSASKELNTSMKSVGEAMAMGRSFKESLQKALRSLETGLSGFDEIALPQDKAKALSLIAKREPERLLRVAEGFRRGFHLDEIHDACQIDPWFLREIQEIILMESQFLDKFITGFEGFTSQDWLYYKQAGFSDERLAKLSTTKASFIRAHRHRHLVRPSYRSVDSCAGEFPSATSYLYSSYDGSFGLHVDEANPSERQKVIILGGGPNRIGQGIEFDYCCVHAAYALKEMDIEAIMVNCNPETVSTDYDTSDRLYFEPLTDEDVLEICFKEQEKGQLLGVIVQFGGQTPLKLSQALNDANIPILGTSSDAIDLAEDRERFQQLIEKEGLKQPANGLATDKTHAIEIANHIGYPIVIRPSYVLGGRAMEIVQNDDELNHYIDHAVVVSGANPVLIDSYLRDAIEVDVDALCDGANVYVAGIMQHIEEAGIHSGDSACSLPPYSLSDVLIDEIAHQTQKLALALNVVGLMNVQFAVSHDEVYILEVNPRASRTAPFVAKATVTPIVSFATKIMAAKAVNHISAQKTAMEKLQDYALDVHSKMSHRRFDHIAVKESVFPFRRFPGVDVLLGPEMKSTGEVMGIDRNFAKAFAKAQLGAGIDLPKSGCILLSVKNDDKADLLEMVKALDALGYDFMATKGTADFYAEHVKMDRIEKAHQGKDNTVAALIEGKIVMVFNTTEANPRAREDSKTMRQEALMRNIPYYTTKDGIKAAALALEAINQDELTTCPLQDYRPYILTS